MSDDLSRKKFLIIDDFSDFRRGVKKILESLGARDIDDAESGEEAVQNMLRKSYDIILCDYNLGHGQKDGQQVLEEVKHRDLIRYSSIFIMLTAENTMPMVMGAVEYQPDDYLIKPITKEILRSRIEKFIKKKADFEEIDKLIRNKEYIHAIELCDERAKSNKGNMLEYLRLKCGLCITIGRYDDATAVCEKVLSMRDIPWANMELGKVYFLTGDYLKAKEKFQSIILENKTYMEAYDWLAKTLEELGSMDEAQQALLTATEISPKAILRHQAIGDISFKIKDYDAAEDAFKSAIEIGNHSCFKSPSEYTGIAKTFLKKDSSEEALSILSEAREEFKGNRNAMLQTAITEGIAYKELNRDEDAKKAVKEASRLLDSLSGKIPVEATMDLAKVCFDLGEKEKGVEFMQNIVRNYHDNDKVIGMVQDVFDDATLQEEGKKIIDSTRNEIVELNNKGVHLVEEKKLEEAIEYFRKAASGLPESKIINANAAQALIMYMRENGKSDQHLYQASQYLERVKKIDPSYEKYQNLLNLYEKISASEAKPER
jgi:tetratricopeptide (TPR) repeat protein